MWSFKNDGHRGRILRSGFPALTAPLTLCRGCGALESSAHPNSRAWTWVWALPSIPQVCWHQWVQGNLPSLTHSEYSGFLKIFQLRHWEGLLGFLKVGRALFNRVWWKLTSAGSHFRVLLSLPGMPHADIYVLVVLCIKCEMGKNKLACCSELILSSTSSAGRGGQMASHLLLG